MRREQKPGRIGLHLSGSDSDIDDSMSHQEELNRRRGEAQRLMAQAINQKRDPVGFDDELQEQMARSYKKYLQKKQHRQQPAPVRPKAQNDAGLSQISQTQTVNQIVKNAERQKSQTLELNLKKYQYLIKMDTQQQTAKDLIQSNSTQTMMSQKKVLKSSGGIIDYKLIPGQTLNHIQGVPVYFPYKPYDLQLAYMDAVIQAVSSNSNALLQSPTGTGKTLCLLASVLSYVESYNMREKEKINIIYCSRTHTQLRQVQLELQKTCFRPTMAIFGSRDQFCLKPQFEQIKGRDLMESCSKAVKLYLKSLKKKLSMEEESSQNYLPPNVQNLNDASMQQNQKKQKKFVCTLYRTEAEYTQIMERHFTKKVITAEILKQSGRMHGFCPYFYSFAIKEKADIIFMPYNYILDVSRLPRYESILKNSIIIFDEAHNVPDAACEGRSYDLHSRIFENADAELAKLEHHPSMSPDLRIVAYEFQDIRQLLLKQYKDLGIKLAELAQKIYDKKHKNQMRTSYDQNYDVQDLMSTQELKVLIYKWFCPLRFDEAKFDKMPIAQVNNIKTRTVKHLEQVVKKTNQLIEALKETYDGIFQQMEKLNGFCEKCLKLIQDNEGEGSKSRDWWEIESNHYRLLIKTNLKINELHYDIKLVCLTPSLTFADLLKMQPRSIILTSGTLSPLDSWEKELNLEFKVQIANKHVIDRSQLHLGVVCKSIGNESQFEFSYESLQKNKGIYTSLLKTIVYFAEEVPNGLLVIFPSYKVINAFKNEFNYDYSLMNKLRSSKHICFEEKGAAEHTVQSFKNKAKSRKGAILFCVCRGKVSEGLDFSDELCRAVIFVGVPYPNVNDPILKEKKLYYNKLSSSMRSKKTKALSGNQWYLLSTMRAVNQGIGRVIRHINDYGMILMLDCRYGQSKLQNLLPGWSKESIETYNDFNGIKDKIRSFYSDMQQKFPNKGVLNEVEQDFSDEVAIKPMPKINRYKKLDRPEQKPKINPLELMMKMTKKASKGSKSKPKKTQRDLI